MPLRVRQGTPIALNNSAVVYSKLLAGMLNVPFFKQEQTNWCWAGCSQMLYHFFGITNIRQCDMASAQFGSNCCASPGSSACNQGAWPENTLGRVGIRAPRQNGSVSIISVRAEIGANRPVMVYYSWSGGGAHVAIIRGFYDNGDLEVSDPWYGPGRRTVNAILSGYGQGRWAMTYLGIRR